MNFSCTPSFFSRSLNAFIPSGPRAILDARAAFLSPTTYIEQIENWEAAFSFYPAKCLQVHLICIKRYRISK